MFKHYGSITVLAVAGVGFSGLSWANNSSSGSSVVLEEALAESLQAPFLFPVEGVTVQAGFSTTHDFLIDTTAFIDTPAGLRLQLAGNMANAAGSRAGLTKTGGGTLVLGGQNTYGGNTRVTAGTLRLEGAWAAGDGLRSVELFSGSTLEYAPDAQVNNMLQLWHPQDEAGNKPAAGQQAAGYTVRLSVPAGMATQAGSIAEAPGAAVNLVKDGAGSLVLQGFTHAPVARLAGVEHLACAAHARRKFVEAKRASPNGKSARADVALELFAQIYRIEAKFRQATDAERFAARQSQSLPILQKLRAWLDETLPVVTPRSKLGEALGYLHKVWLRLIRYTERGDLPIDNNLLEGGAIKPFVVGRKGWMFCDTPAGAHASAVLYSLLQTAGANGREPYAWLRFVLERLPLAKTVDEIEALLPWNIHDQDLAMNLAASE